VNTQVIIEI